MLRGDFASLRAPQRPGLACVARAALEALWKRQTAAEFRRTAGWRGEGRFASGTSYRRQQPAPSRCSLTSRRSPVRAWDRPSARSRFPGGFWCRCFSPPICTQRAFGSAWRAGECGHGATTLTAPRADGLGTDSRRSVPPRSALAARRCLPRARPFLPPAVPSVPAFANGSLTGRRGTHSAPPLLGTVGTEGTATSEYCEGADEWRIATVDSPR